MRVFCIFVEFLREMTKKKRYGIAKEFIADFISLPPSRNVQTHKYCVSCDVMSQPTPQQGEVPYIYSN